MTSVPYKANQRKAWCVQTDTKFNIYDWRALTFAQQQKVVAILLEDVWQDTDADPATWELVFPQQL